MNICPVCGNHNLLEPPYSLEYGSPSHEICGCCGFEYGYDDSDQGYTFEAYREKWIENGFQYADEEEKPANWSKEVMLKQLENIKKVNYKARI